MNSWHYNDIVIFIMVAEQKSYTKAAKKLKLPKSTVSRRVSHLEDQLKIRLLERSSRKVQLTHKGQALYAENKALFSQINLNLKNLTDSLDDISGIIKITAPVLLANSLLNKMLIEFQQKYPNVSFNLQVSDEAEDIIADGFDLAIRLGPLSDSNFVCQKIWRPKFVICATPHYASQNIILEPKKLLNYELILNCKDSLNVTFTHRQTKIAQKLSLYGVHYSNSIDYNLQATLSGKGIAEMPQYYVQNALNDGKLVQILPEYELTEAGEFFAIYPSRRHLSKKINTLINFLKHQFSEIE